MTIELEDDHAAAVIPSASTMRLGRTDLIVSRIGVGTASWGKDNLLNVFGSTEHPQDEQAAFRRSLAEGMTFFDTAAQYKSGNSEVRLGELARGTEAIIATKYSPRLLFLPVFPRSSRYLPKALDLSLSRLGRSTIDLYQIHSPFPFVRIRKLMDRMADAVEAGKIRAVGVSNYSEAQMREAHAALAARGIPLASNQIQYSLLYRRPEFDGVLDACRELGITPIAYMPMAMGLLTGKYKVGAIPKDWVRRRLTPLFRPEELAGAAVVTERLAEIGARYGKTPAQVALRWVIEQGVIPIPGAKKESQAVDNAGALTFSLSRDEVEELAESATAWIQAPKWKFAPAVAKK